MNSRTDAFPFHSLLNTALLCFILAGSTGFLFRLSMVYPLSLGLNLANIRHAHSHLMFFGWAIPLPMIFILRYLSVRTSSAIKPLKRIVGLLFFMAFVAYPFFLLFGYHPVPLPGKSLPVAAMLSGLIMLGWYAFIVYYMKARRNMKSSPALVFYDAALLMLALSSLGAWGVSLTQFFHAESALLAQSMTHFFLTTFTEGWCVLSVLGVAYDVLEVEKTCIEPNRLVAPIVLGGPLMFPFGVSAGLLTPLLLWTARFGGLLVAAGLLLNLRELLGREIGAWKWPLVFMALKVLMQLVAAVSPSAFWAGQPSLRILYLHTVLLGFFSLGLFTGLKFILSQIGPIRYRMIIAAVILLIASLLPLTRFWPHALSGAWIFTVVAVVALLPVVGAIPWLWSGRRDIVKY